MLSDITMKLDGVALYDRTPSHELAVNAIGDCDKHMTVNMLKPDTESETGWKQDTTLPRESKISVEADPSLCPHSSEHHNDSDTKGFFKSSQNEGEFMEARCLLPTGETEVVQNGADSCPEKSVAEIELPGTRIKFMDGAFQNVKDICIDEGVYSVEKVLAESTEDQQSSYRFKQNGNHDLREDMDSTTEETYDNGNISYDMMPSSVTELCVFVDGKEDSKHCSLEHSLADGYKLDIVAPSVTTTSKKQFPALQEFDTDPWQVDSLSSDSIGNKKQLDQDTLEAGDSIDGKDSSPAVEEPIQNSGKKESSANGEVESGVITFHFDSREATVSGKDEPKECSDNQQTGEVCSAPKTEEATVDGATASARSSFVHYGFGDSNFNGPAALSGHIASSGHILYSGSTSLRSDSSTTSARSFAFPILQSEWNTSPVKMAKADRRRLRKHRGWRMGLLCCKF